MLLVIPFTDRPYSWEKRNLDDRYWILNWSISMLFKQECMLFGERNYASMGCFIFYLNKIYFPCTIWSDQMTIVHIILCVFAPVMCLLALTFWILKDEKSLGLCYRFDKGCFFWRSMSTVKQLSRNCSWSSSKRSLSELLSDGMIPTTKMYAK